MVTRLKRSPSMCRKGDLWKIFDDFGPLFDWLFPWYHTCIVTKELLRLANFRTGQYTGQLV